MVKGRCVFLSLVLRLVEGDSGASEGVALEPRPLLAGEAGGVEAVEPLEEVEDRPLAALRTPDPLEDKLWVMSSGVDWTHFLLEGGGVRGGGERESARLFMALVPGTGHRGGVNKHNHWITLAAVQNRPPRCRRPSCPPKQ